MVSSLHASPKPGLKCFGGLARLWNVFWPFNSFCAFEMHASPAAPVAEVAAEVLQGPTSTFAAHSASSLGRSQDETSCRGAADNVMLGYANLAKAWKVAHNGGESVDLF